MLTIEHLFHNKMKMLSLAHGTTKRKSKKEKDVYLSIYGERLFLFLIFCCGIKKQQDELNDDKMAIYLKNNTYFLSSFGLCCYSTSTQTIINRTKKSKHLPNS